jgi:hypothetical protein
MVPGGTLRRSPAAPPSGKDGASVRATAQWLTQAWWSRAYILSAMAFANSLVLSRVAPVMSRSKS